MNGTGTANSHPNTKTFFLFHLLDRLPAKRLSIALTIPKLAMKDRINTLDSRPNSSFPKSGMTVCS
jgi:hypothetical protein